MQFTFSSFHSASFPCIVVVGSVSTALLWPADWGALKALALGSRGMGPGALALGASCMPRAPPKFPSSKPQICTPCPFPLRPVVFRAHHGPCSAPPCHPRWPRRGVLDLVLWRPTARPFSLPVRDPTSLCAGCWAASRCAGSAGGAGNAGLADDGSKQVRHRGVPSSSSSSAAAAAVAPGFCSRPPRVRCCNAHWLAARSGKSLACLNRGE